MTENTAPEFPLMQRDHAPGALVEEHTLYVLQYRDEEGRWMEFLTPDDDRDKMTRIQAHRLLDTEHHGEKRRVMRRTTQIWVDEVEGDGPGETCAEELLERNRLNTERLLEKDKEHQPGT